MREWARYITENLVNRHNIVLMYSLARVSRLINCVSQLIARVSRLLACARVKTGDVGLFPLLII